MPKRPRVLIYVRGLPDERAEQADRCARYIGEHGYQLVGVAFDEPPDRDGWADAERMLDAGEVDRIILVSAANIPQDLESVTGSLPAGQFTRPADQRIKPIRRDGGA
jgi:hypothetical protein